MSEKFQFPKLFLGSIITYVVLLTLIVLLPDPIISQLPYIVKTILFLVFIGLMGLTLAILMFNLAKSLKHEKQKATK